MKTKTVANGNIEWNEDGYYKFIGLNESDKEPIPFACLNCSAVLTNTWCDFCSECQTGKRAVVDSFTISKMKDLWELGKQNEEQVRSISEPSFNQSEFDRETICKRKDVKRLNLEKYITKINGSDCLGWGGEFKNGLPVMKVLSGTQFAQPVAFSIWKNDGKRIGKVLLTCSKPDCMNFEHMERLK